MAVITLDEDPTWAEKLVLGATEQVLSQRDLHALAAAVRAKVRQARLEARAAGADAMRTRCAAYVKEIADELDRIARKSVAGTIAQGVIEDGMCLLMNVVNGVQGLPGPDDGS